MRIRLERTWQGHRVVALVSVAVAAFAIWSLGTALLLTLAGLGPQG